MKANKFNILFYFLKFRWSRIYSSARVPNARKKKWKSNLMKSNYYRPYLEEERDFPLIDKEVFMENFNAINTVGIDREHAFRVAEKAERTRNFQSEINGIAVGLSSGTSGNKGIFLTSVSEQEMWVGAILDRVLGFSLRKRKIAFFLRANNELYESVGSVLLEFRFFDLKKKLDQLHRELWEYQPTILVAQPSVLYELAKYYKKERITSKIEKIISVAEVLETDMHDYLNNVFNCPITQVYQCTEGFLAYTCKNGNLHFNEDLIEIEKKYIDDRPKVFHPIITDYLRSSQPVVRYQMNDIIHEGEPCECGSKAMVIKKIEGRMDDVFIFNEDGNEILVFPDFIRREVISVSDQISNYQVSRVGNRSIQISLESNHHRLYKEIEMSLSRLFDTLGIKGIVFKRATLEVKTMEKFTRVKNRYYTK